MSFALSVIFPFSDRDLPGGKFFAEGPVDRTTRMAAEAAVALDARRRATAMCRALTLF
jgi:hypothetical protein